MKPSTFSNSCS